MVCLDSKQLGSTSMNCSNMGHSYEGFAYLFGRNTSFLFSHQTKDSPVDLLKLVTTKNFGLIRESANKFLTSFRKN